MKTMFPLRSKVTTVGRQASGARALWRATGTKENDFGKPIVAIANSYTQFVPGHVHLKNVGDIVADAVREAGGVPKEFNTIAVDDGIAMGAQRHALLAAFARNHLRFHRVHGECPHCRRPGVHLQLR